MTTDRRQRILNLAEDLMSNFLFYDRKEDEDLPVDAIEEAIINGEITTEEILDVFRRNLTVNVNAAQKD